MLFSTPLITVYSLTLMTLIGLVSGSFLNCAAIRIVTGEKFATGRSHCMSCGHVLSPLDLVPLFSWLFLRGKCRYCGKKISFRYPLSELITAAVFVSLLLRYDFSLRFLELLLLSAILLCASFADLEGYIIPNRLILGAIAVRIVFVLIRGLVTEKGTLGTLALQSIIGGFSVALPLFILALIMDKVLKKESMGGGDIKLMFCIGLYFDWKINILIMLIACVLGIVFGIIALSLRIKKQTQAEEKAKAASAENPDNPGPNDTDTGTEIQKIFPFGPSIACAAWICMLCGEAILSAYMGLF